MRRVAAIFGALALVCLPALALSAISPEPGVEDPRVRVVHYDPNNVVELTATLGYQMTIEFGPGERVENVSIGDGLGWQITPNHRADLLFLKPLDARSVTDMTVITNLRRYVFDLKARRASKSAEKSLTFRLRFEYPEPYVAVVEPAPIPPPQPPAEVNRAYRVVGKAVIVPSKVFDDGRSTYFAFASTAEIPAIFAIDPDGREAVVNTAIHQGYVVVDRLASAFILRQGHEATRIVNDGFQVAGLARQPAPPAKKHRGLFKW